MLRLHGKIFKLNSINSLCKRKWRSQTKLRLVIQNIIMWSRRFLDFCSNLILGQKLKTPNNEFSHGFYGNKNWTMSRIFYNLSQYHC